MSREKGMIFNILRYTLDDGPGIRSTVFMKGCPLRCAWCANPESQHFHMEVVHRDTSCIQCLSCVNVCPENCVRVEPKSIHIDRSRCTNCGKCVEICPTDTMQYMGKEMTAEEAFAIVARDKQYYENSGGGLTISGGEPLSQANFVASIFQMAHDSKFHTNLDTSGFAAREDLNKVLTHTDLVYYDLKTMDPEIHKKWAGQTNEVILGNLKHIVDKGIDLVFRVPVVPGMNDNEEAIAAIADHASYLRPGSILHLLPFHRFGIGKYKILDQSFHMGNVQRPEQAHLKVLKSIVDARGLICEIRE